LVTDLVPDEWLNDLDVRQILHGLVEAVREAGAALPEGAAIDARFAGAAIETDECPWGPKIAESRGWTRHGNWWYSRGLVPRRFRAPSRQRRLRRADEAED
jgi:hypothetical protein